MPRRRSPASLEIIALKSIVYSIEDVIRVDRFAGLLPCLTGTLLNQLVARIVDEYGDDDVFEAVVLPQITQVKLPQGSSTSVIRWVEERCTTLTSLQIPYLKTASMSIVNNILERNPNLELVNLRGTSINDQTIKSIGSACSKLQSLDISRTGISDEGILYLPLSLRYLNIASTNVIPIGVYHFLQKNPHICKVEYEAWDEVCRCIQIMGEAEGSVCLRSDLKELALVGCKGVLEEVLETASLVFPSLVSVSLRKCDLNRRTLECLQGAWKHLKHLELGNSNFSQYTISFYEHVTPVLEQAGHSLHSLSLEKLKYVDVVSISELCPRLSTLKLSRILSYSNIEPNQFPRRLMNELQELVILNSLGSRITEKTLIFLLSSPKLDSVSLQLVPSFHSPVWDVLDFTGLSVLSLEECHGVSLDFILNLLRKESTLQRLDSYSCTNIGEEERDIVLDIIREENLDLEFNWHFSRLGSLHLDLDLLEIEEIQNRAEFL